MKIVSLVLLLNITFTYGQFNTNQLNDRSVIVHFFEWKFSDIAIECERWLGPKGIGAIQVSSIKNLNLFQSTK